LYLEIFIAQKQYDKIFMVEFYSALSELYK